MGLLDASLRPWPLRSPGFLRSDDGRSYPVNNWYDLQEWVVIDLRVAAALVRMNRAADARVLLDWVDAQAAANMNLISELYDAVSSDYQGAVPMVGFGAGAWILGTYDYYTQPPT
jgi:GH15 family glucan-1,4-alpha-glucosidase